MVCFPKCVRETCRHRSMWVCSCGRGRDCFGFGWAAEMEVVAFTREQKGWADDAFELKFDIQCSLIMCVH